MRKFEKFAHNKNFLNFTEMKTTAAALKAARRATIAARAWLHASHEFYAQDGDPIRCTGWQFVGYNIAAAVVAVLLSIKY